MNQNVVVSETTFSKGRETFQLPCIKLGYLIKLKKNKMIDYAHEFLSDEVVDILNEILKKQAICCK